MWDFEKNSREALLHLFLEYKINEYCNVDFDSFTQRYEAINHDLWHLYGIKQTTKEELRYQRFYKTFLHFNYDNLSLAHQWADDYLKISPYKTNLINGAADVLNYLSKQQYHLHIITNGFKEVQEIKLQQCNIKHYFNEIIISEEIGYHKPDIKIFDLAQKLTRTSHNECVMIGDNFDTDIIGALKAKWQAIYLANVNREDVVNHLHINSLLKLKDIF